MRGFDMTITRYRRLRRAAAVAPVFLLGGCVSGPQIRDFAITEFARVVSDVAGQFIGAFLSGGLGVA